MKTNAEPLGGAGPGSAPPIGPGRSFKKKSVFLKKCVFYTPGLGLGVNLGVVRFRITDWVSCKKGN